MCLLLKLIDHNRNLFAKINAAIRMERYDLENQEKSQELSTSEEHIANLVLSALPVRGTPEISKKILKINDMMSPMLDVPGNSSVRQSPQLQQSQQLQSPQSPQTPQQSPQSQQSPQQTPSQNVALAILTLVSLYGLSKSDAWFRVKKYMSGKTRKFDKKTIKYPVRQTLIKSKRRRRSK